MVVRPTRIYYLDDEQNQAIVGLIQLRLNELRLIRENPNIIDLYASALIQLKGK
jgi:hypothetical protein